MKKIFIAVILLVLICVACINNSNKDTNAVESSMNSSRSDSLSIEEPLVIDEGVLKLNGVWAENEEENALFMIKNKSLYYIEDQGTALPIEISGDTLTIRGELTIYCNILKVTKDSLWYTDQYSDDTTKLYKRK